MITKKINMLIKKGKRNFNHDWYDLVFNNIWKNRIICNSLLLITVVIAFKRICVGLDFNDYPFYLHMYVFEDITSFLTFPGLYIIVKPLVSFLEYHYFYFRLISVLMIFVQFFVIYKLLDFMYTNSEIKVEIRPVLSIVVFIFYVTSSVMFNIDLLSSFILTFIVYYYYRIYLNSKVKYALILGLLSLIAVSFRISNLIIIFPSVIIISLSINRETHKDLLKTNLNYLFYYFVPFFTITLGLFIYLFYTDSHIDFFSVLMNSIQNLLASQSHNPYRLITSYYRDGVVLSRYFIVIALVYYLNKFIREKTNIRFISLILLFVLAVYLLKINFESYTFLRHIKLFVTSTLCFLCFLTVISKCSIKDKMFILSLTLCSFVPAFGSGTGLLKAVNLSALMIPIFILFNYNNDQRDIFYRYLLYSFIPVSLYVGIFWSYGDINSPLTQLNAININKLKYIHTTEHRVDYVESIYYNYRDELADNDLLLIGDPANLFYYLFGKEPFHRTRFIHRIDDKLFIERAIEEIVTRKIYPIIIYLPGRQYQPLWPQSLKSQVWSGEGHFKNFVEAIGELGYQTNIYDTHSVSRKKF